MSGKQADDVLERIAAALEELLVWTRVTSYGAVARILGEEFGGDGRQTASRVKVYALSDGEMPIREISAVLGGKPDFTTVSKMQARWRKMGLAALVNPTNQRSPTRALFDVSDFGIDVELPTSAGSEKGSNSKTDQGKETRHE